MFHRKLAALKHPNPSTVNIENELDFNNTILWLEEQKIRHYKIEDRTGLRRTENSSVWNKAFLDYLNEIKCPYQFSEDNRAEVFDWLLGFAVRLEYGDSVENLKTVSDKNSKSESDSGGGANPLMKIDFNSADVKAGVVSLAQLLHIPPHPDHLQVLRAICELVKEKFSVEAMERAKKNTSKKDYVGLDKIDLGFECGDYVSNEAAKIIRLIQIHNLRDLQTQINAAIVAVQSVTADPKTDTKLGKVGR